MKLHTSLLMTDIGNALTRVKELGLVAEDIRFMQFTIEGSRSRPYGYRIQLGTYNQHSGPTRSRRYKNSGRSGATTGYDGNDRVWAATYDEWGWFIGEIFLMDPSARFGSYDGAMDFYEQTGGRFRPSAVPSVRYAPLTDPDDYPEPEKTGPRMWVNTLHP